MSCRTPSQKEAHVSYVRIRDLQLGLQGLLGRKKPMKHVTLTLIAESRRVCLRWGCFRKETGDSYYEGLVGGKRPTVCK